MLAPDYPKHLRWATEPWGISANAPQPQHAEDDNARVRGALHIIDFLFKFHIPFVFEHLQKTVLWNSQEFIVLASMNSSHSVALDQRLFFLGGERWCKGATLVFGICDGVDFVALAEQSCHRHRFFCVDAQEPY